VVPARDIEGAEFTKRIGDLEATGVSGEKERDRLVACPFEFRKKLFRR